jgi:hypothetical protein
MGRMFLATFVTLLLTTEGRADDYFLTLFTAESVPFHPEKTHTFVAVTRLPGDGGVAETHEIGWLAESTRVRGLTLLPERGKNYTTAESIAICRRERMRVSVWGPYRIHPELFGRLRDQARRLNEGKVLYKGTDNLYPSCVAMNCYHAIWNVVAPLRKYAGPFNCGDATGPVTLRLFRDWLIGPEQTHDDILKLIGVDQEPLVRRGYDERPTRFDAARSFLCQPGCHQRAVITPR